MKTMTIYEEVAVGVTAETVCDFIRNHADKEDKAHIREAIFGEERIIEPVSLAEDLKMEAVKKIADKYSLNELIDFEKKLTQLINNPGRRSFSAGGQ